MLITALLLAVEASVSYRPLAPRPALPMPAFQLWQHDLASATR